MGLLGYQHISQDIIEESGLLFKPQGRWRSSGALGLTINAYIYMSKTLTRLTKEFLTLIGVIDGQGLSENPLVNTKKLPISISLIGVINGCGLSESTLSTENKSAISNPTDRMH